MLTAIALAAPVAAQPEPPGKEGGKQRRAFGGPGGPAGPGAFFGAGLSEEEQQKMRAAAEKAFADDPSLKAEGDELRGLRDKVQSGAATPQDAFAKMKAFGEKMDAALLKADPSLGPILEKRNAARRERFGGMKGPGGFGGGGFGRPGGAPDKAPGGGAGGAFSDTPPPVTEPPKTE